MEKPGYVLVLDDEANILHSIKRQFFFEPFSIHTTTDPQQAFDLLAKGGVKLVISDQRMSAMSGVEFLKQVKDKYPQIIRILLTGHADIQAAEEAVNVGQVYRFITKPWDPEELKRTVRQAISLYDLTIDRQRLFEDIQVMNKELLSSNNRLQMMVDRQKEFTSTVSHELRTPLAAMKMALDIVLSGTSGPLTDDQRNFLNKAKSNVDRLHRLINDILDLTKMEMGKISMKIERGNLSSTIDEAVDAQKSLALNKGLELQVDYPAVNELVFFDKDRILQVMVNLLSNAIKFTEKGAVTVKLLYDHDRNIAEVRVCDSGPGIKPEDISKLFEKFQQLEGAFNNKTGGTGLGLAICKTIIEAHQGKIWAESQLGQGSQFCFIIPIEERRKG